MTKNIYKTFDYLGFPAFTILFIDALYDIITDSFTWRTWIRLVVCFAGMIVDGYLIFIHKEK